MSILKWTTKHYEAFTFIEFTLATELIKPSDLAETDLPAGLENHRNLGLIISGRGPIWLYAHLVHRAHPFAWVAVYDPRLNSSIVVMNHIPDGPAVGTLVPVA
ncbi:MAG: CRISPR-associated ring nuclease Crn3/Csx3 [bacterium]